MPKASPPERAFTQISSCIVPGMTTTISLVIEAKKSTNPVTDDADVAKLAQIKGQIGYAFAVFLRLPTGPEADPADLRIIWI